jgi:hypothetical protein
MCKIPSFERSYDLKMKKITIEIKGCYGIKKLSKAEFDFNEYKAYIIYAPNGSMKTSFAKTMYDYSEGKKSYDNISDIEGTCMITSDKHAVNPNEVFVVRSYDDKYTYREDVATLLISPSLRKQYAEIKNKIDLIKKEVVEFLRKKSSLKKEEVELEMLKVFNEKNFIDIWPALEYKLNSDLKNNFAELQYSLIFNERVLEPLKNEEFQIKLEKYLQIYDTLINQSTILKKTDKNIFDHNNVKNILKNLKDNGFFSEETNNNSNPIRSLRIWTGKEYEYFATAKELEERIEAEIKHIESNQEYRKAFDEINDKLERPADVKKFGDFLRTNKSILTELRVGNLDLFRKEIWISYFHEKKDLFLSLINTIKESDKQIKEIQEKAKSPEVLQTWRHIIEEYNRNFLILDKKLEVIEDDFTDIVLGLKTFQAKLGYRDGKNYKSFNSDKQAENGVHLINDILSQGEKRVLYLLDVMFDIKVREKVKNESGTDIKTLFIIDDIADSFDYQNKYAIIEYLKRIAYEDKFYQIILTHNYDFFRAIKRKLCDNKTIKCEALIATRFDWGVSLNICDKKLDDPFSQWRDIGTAKHLICLIPFVRNIATYTGNNKYVYDKLTSLLHMKNERPLLNDDGTLKCTIKATKDITIQELINIMKDEVKITEHTLINSGKINVQDKVFDLIKQEAEKCSNNADEKFGIEEKIVLSIAIRLLAEDFMINEILKNDKTFNISTICSNQAVQLFTKYKAVCKDNIRFNEAKKVLEKVDLITPENIHLNSFMYEPILDMSSSQLKLLYKECRNLNSNSHF